MLRYILSLVLLVCLVQTGYAGRSDRDEELKNILLVSSYFPSNANSNIIINSFLQELHSLVECRLRVEYMDSELSPDFAQWREWMTQLFEVHQTRPDVVVIIGCEAWAAYRATCSDSWREIPVVLGFVKEGYVDYEHHAPDQLDDIKDVRSMTETFGDFRVTGYFVRDYFEENLALIHRLQPSVRRIAYVYDNRFGFRLHSDYLRRLVYGAGFEELIPLYGNLLTTNQLSSRILDMDDSYAILSSGWYIDANHYAHAYSMLHNEIYRSKFFYNMMDQGATNPNYMGGYFVQGKDIGRDVASLTYEVISRGIEHSPRFQATPSLPRYYINNTALSSSGIDRSLLPADTVLRNFEPSFWRTYSWHIAVIVLVILLIFVWLLGRMRYYRRITAIKARMMEEQRALRHKADEANRQKSAFLANMSHEIRTPLNAIVGFSSLMSEVESPEEAQEYMEIIAANNELLLQLVNDILDLSKIEAGQLEFTYTDTDLVELCRSLEAVYRDRLQPGVELRCEVPDASCVISTERTRVTQVLSNFLSNAVKFTSRGSIRFGYEHRAKGLRFYVTDTGKGIAPENLPKVFERFEKFDRSVQGNGLGMSICKGIVERLGGRIGVESVEGKGSTFWFTLPGGKR